MARKEELAKRLAKIRQDEPIKTLKQLAAEKKLLQEKMAEHYGSWDEYKRLQEAGYFEQVK